MSFYRSEEQVAQKRKEALDMASRCRDKKIINGLKCAAAIAKCRNISVELRWKRLEKAIDAAK